jgi:hypothetical protein
LGKSVIAGKSLVSYERHEFLEKASQFFSLSDPASVIMTDQSPGFTLAVENMQQTHLLCQKHFTTEMLHATTGMDQEIRTKFMNECHSAILDDFETEIKFSEYIATMKLSYSAYVSAVKYVKRIEKNKLKICTCILKIEILSKIGLTFRIKEKFF